MWLFATGRTLDGHVIQVAADTPKKSVVVKRSSSSSSTTPTEALNVTSSPSNTTAAVPSTSTHGSAVVETKAVSSSSSPSSSKPKHATPATVKPVVRSGHRHGSRSSGQALQVTTTTTGEHKHGHPSIYSEWPLIDIGANLASKHFRHDINDVINRATASGVSHMILTGSDLRSSTDALALAQKRKFGSLACQPIHYIHSYGLNGVDQGILYSTAGIHPHQ
jgi:hypothetical protein